MRKISYTNQFQKDYKRCQKRNLNINMLEHIVEQLCQGQHLAKKFHDHALRGNYQGYRECHIQPDWLLIYYISDENILILVRTGSHADLFDK